MPRIIFEIPSDERKRKKYIRQKAKLIIDKWSSEEIPESEKRAMEYAIEEFIKSVE